MEKVNQVLGVGQYYHTQLHAPHEINIALLDLKWKVGVAMSSDSCRSLNSPYVAMAIKVADPSGRISCHNFEMTIQQFQNFSKQLQDMAHVLETV